MSGSYFQLNQKYNTLLALLEAITPLPVDSLADVLLQGNSAGATDIDMNNQDILQVNNIDVVNINGSAYPPVAVIPNLTQVLTAGDTAVAPLKLVIQDTASKTTTLFGSAIDIELDNGITTDLTGYGTSSIGHSGDSNFALSTDKNLLITSNNLNTTAAGAMSLLNSSVGFTSSPSLLINNTNNGFGNTIGVPSIKFSKTGRNGAVNDIVGSVFFNALDIVGAERTFGKIESTITTTIQPTNHDGALDFYTLINGVNQLVFRLNGADNENNSFRPLDLNGNILKTSVNNLIIDATQSVDQGIISLKPKTTGHIIIPSSSNPFLDFIKLQPDVSTGAQSIDMNATNINTGAQNSINITNTTTAPSIQIIANTSGVGVIGNPFLNITSTDSVTNIQRTTNASTTSIITEVFDFNTLNTKQIGISTALGLKLINNLDTDPLVIESTNTSNDGSIEFKPDFIGGDLIFTGANIQSASAGGITTQFLRIKLNGVYYKIQLSADL